MTRAVITTELGDIEVDLFTESAPKAAANFVKLAKDGFFDDVIFHRVIPGFMIQGGDGQFGKKASLSKDRVGTGGPGYKFEDEPFKGSYTRGTLAMANAGPNTNGSQFFITVAATPWLDGKHVVFGKVIEGLDVLQKIEAQGSPSGQPQSEVKLAACKQL
jgi:cyclophilin family peptidyl-prolyl cis-trans isomerase